MRVRERALLTWAEEGVAGSVPGRLSSWHGGPSIRHLSYTGTWPAPKAARPAPHAASPPPRSGWSRFYRQTILLSSFASPEMNALLGRRCANHAGCLRLRPAYPGVLSQVLPQVCSVFGVCVRWGGGWVGAECVRAGTLGVGTFCTLFLGRAEACCSGDLGLLLGWATPGTRRTFTAAVALLPLPTLSSPRTCFIPTPTALPHPPAGAASV